MKYDVKYETTLMPFLLEQTNKKRADVKKLLKYENVWVDGHVETYYALPLKVGQVVEIKKAQNKLPFPLIYEDHEIIVIDKPCGLLTEQTATESQKTAYFLIKEYLKEKHEKVYLVHRLDQYTSGLLMFVKTKKLYDLLTHDWNKYVKIRGYIAIVEGHLKKKNGTIENYLAESKSQQVYITTKEKGKKAITHYKQIKTNKYYSLVEVNLDTGRKNQIRVHMASLHNPIVGDHKYGAKTNPLNRLGLHAHEFVIIHPITLQKLRFVSKTPEIFNKLFKKG